MIQPYNIKIEAFVAYKGEGQQTKSGLKGCSFPPLQPGWSFITLLPAALELS